MRSSTFYRRIVTTLTIMILIGQAHADSPVCGPDELEILIEGGLTKEEAKAIQNGRKALEQRDTLLNRVGGLVRLNRVQRFSGHTGRAVEQQIDHQIAIINQELGYGHKETVKSVFNRISPMFTRTETAVNIIKSLEPSIAAMKTARARNPNQTENFRDLPKLEKELESNYKILGRNYDLYMRIRGYLETLAKNAPPDAAAATAARTNPRLPDIAPADGGVTPSDPNAPVDPNSGDGGINDGFYNSGFGNGGFGNGGFDSSFGNSSRNSTQAAADLARYKRSAALEVIKRIKAHRRRAIEDRVLTDTALTMDAIRKMYDKNPIAKLERERVYLRAEYWSAFRTLVLQPTFTRFLQEAAIRVPILRRARFIEIVRMIQDSYIRTHLVDLYQIHRMADNPEAQVERIRSLAAQDPAFLNTLSRSVEYEHLYLLTRDFVNSRLQQSPGDPKYVGFSERLDTAARSGDGAELSLTRGPLPAKMLSEIVVVGAFIFYLTAQENDPLEVFFSAIKTSVKGVLHGNDPNPEQTPGPEANTDTDSGTRTDTGRTPWETPATRNPTDSRSPWDDAPTTRTQPSPARPATNTPGRDDTF